MATVEQSLCGCGAEITADKWTCPTCFKRGEWARLIEQKRILTAAIDEMTAQRETLEDTIGQLAREIIHAQLNN